MNLLQKINQKTLEIANAKAEYCKRHSDQQKQQELTFLAKLIELYSEIKELNGQKIKFNSIEYDTGYDPRPPQYNTISVTLKVELLDTYIRMRLLGYVFSYGHISICKNFDDDDFFIQAWGFNKRFKNRKCSTVDKAKEELVDILSNLNEF